MFKSNPKRLTTKTFRKIKSETKQNIANNAF